MCRDMANQEEKPGIHLRKQLAAAIRSIQWSYAIFWSLSTRQQGMLEWGDGYYNGDIKTRKTVQSMEVNVNEMGLQRSEQLRELYQSLSAGDANQQSRRPAALSPEDLTDAEWFYLVCMSFVFNLDQGLPGKVFTTGQPIWLCNAHYADSKEFVRSLLAKSASIKTVVCFPFWNGVIELGVTELVLEDPKIIQHVKTSFLEFPKPVCSDQSTSNTKNSDNDEDPVCIELNHNIVNSIASSCKGNCKMQLETESLKFPFSFTPFMDKEELKHDENEEFKSDSLHECSNRCEPNTEDSYLLDEEFSDCVHDSRNSSDCISQTLVNPGKTISSLKGEKINNIHLHDLQECIDTKINLVDHRSDDTHYSRTLATIFRYSNKFIAPCFLNGHHKSSFISWNHGGLVDAQKPYVGKPQKLLKKILFKVALKENGGKNELRKPTEDDIGSSHELPERRQPENLNEKFLVLRSLVPSIPKVDETTILDDTIEYLKELEQRLEELESCRELMEFEVRARRKHPDIVERTSDNYANIGTVNGKKASLNKRKASDIDEIESELNWVLHKDSSAIEVTVNVIQKEVLIEISCLWRECLVIDIMEAASNLHLDPLSIQSSIVHDILSLSVKSKFNGAGIASEGMIKQEVQRVINKC